MLEIATELGALGCRKVTLSGGEPTLNPYWPEIAERCRNQGMRVTMITNGLVSADRLLRQAREVKLAGLGVSLEGLERAHDLNRRRLGLYSKVMELIDTGQQLGVPIAAITTITKRNQRQLEQLYELLAGRVYAWQVQIGAAMGNLSDHRSEQVDPQDLLEIVPTLARLVKRGRLDVHVADNVGYYGPHEETLRKRRHSPLPCWVGCYAGCRHLGIEADGGVKGCLSLQATTATEGNLQTERLAEIWHREGAFAYNRGFSLEDLAGFCRSCEHAEICRGGCLSMRTCEGGRENPFCYHRVAVLAQRRRRGRSRYVPMMVAPAALLALLGIGCSGENDRPAPDGGLAGASHMPGGEGGAAGEAEGPGQMDPGQMVVYGAEPPDQPAPPDQVDAGAPDAGQTSTGGTGSTDDPPLPVPVYGVEPVDVYGVEPVDAGVEPVDASVDPADAGSVDASVTEAGAVDSGAADAAKDVEVAIVVYGIDPLDGGMQALYGVEPVDTAEESTE
jgi:radical SAM protein with 4Fe4S-binding SPASM domain